MAGFPKVLRVFLILRQICKNPLRVQGRMPEHVVIIEQSLMISHALGTLLYQFAGFFVKFLIFFRFWWKSRKFSEDL